MAEILMMLSIMILPKNMTRDLAQGLTHEEFRCRCHRKSCHFTLMAESLKISYEAVRIGVARPLLVNSGFRCQSHNRDVGGTDTSSHTTGHAIDISYAGLNEKEKNLLIDLAEIHFNYVKVYPGFIHCHNQGEGSSE